MYENIFRVTSPAFDQFRWLSAPYTSIVFVQIIQFHLKLDLVDQEILIEV